MTPATPIEFEAAWLRLWAWAGCPDASEWRFLMAPYAAELLAAMRTSEAGAEETVRGVASRGAHGLAEWYWAAAVDVWSLVPASVHAQRSVEWRRQETFRLLGALGLSDHWKVKEWLAAGADPAEFHPFGSRTQHDLGKYVIARVFGPMSASLVLDIRQLADIENRAAFERVHAEVPR